MQRRSGNALLVAVLLVVQLACWRGSSRLRSTSLHTSPPLLKRSLWDESGASKHKDKHTSTGKHPHHTSTTSSTRSPPSTTSHSPTTSTALPTSSHSVIPCQPLPFANSSLHLCEHVRLHCPPAGHLDYLRFYYCIGVSDPSPTPAAAAPQLTLRDTDETAHEAKKSHPPAEPAPEPSHLTSLRALSLTCIIAWMLFLFSWVGVVASDFFCPNLGTIAARLGLSESTAGVTFLAFGNGSPDVFSTFGAMKTGSGSLAIGELIGAASFIVSVISGSMMLIAPFRVKAYPFLRDVGYFTVAVAMTMMFLLDGKLRFDECLGMIALYLAYATTVIVGSWWQERQRRKKQLMSSIREEYSTGSVASRATSTSADMERQSSRHLAVPASPAVQISPNEYDPDVDPFVRWQQTASGEHSRAGSPNHSPLLTGYDLPTTSTYGNTTFQRRPIAGARHSLLGAVEFRDVVRTLQQEALADRTLEIFQSRDPERFFPHHHHHHHHQHQSVDSQRLQPPLSSHRGHARVRSLVAPGDGVRRDGAASSEGRAILKPKLFRSRSTIGVGAGSSSAPDAEAANTEWSITRRTQPSAFDASAVAAAVGDPWKEHNASDGCEQTLLPPPARPLDDEDVPSADMERPSLQIQTDSNGLDNVTRRNSRGKRADGQRAMRTGDVKDLTTREAIQRAASPTLKALFPSLRHFHEKSWLGIAVSIITAPAIMVLNLTLPVVDDEAERVSLSGEKIATLADVGNSSDGRIRLEGSEGDIYATTRRVGDEEEDAGNDPDDDDDDNIITLAAPSPPPNPWSSPDVEGQYNRQSNLEIASALRKLPQNSMQLLSPHSNSDTPLLSSPGRQQKSPNVLTDGTDSEADSCDSQDSHMGTQSSHLFLVVAQCIFAPPFIVWAISSSANSSHIGLKTTVALLAGVGVSLVVLLAILRFRHHLNNRGMSRQSLGICLAAGWTRVAVGFVVSILYIMTIVDEVVSILQTLGIILGLSDAILGLTVFAMGNSLGDLVANVTIAKMGHPVMAISACFAGPLLNLLLGIGISGTWLLSGNRMSSIPNQPDPTTTTALLKLRDGMYHIDFSPTLIVSGIGLLVILLGTMIAVPLNGFYLNRAIGLTLIITYAVIMTVNVMVEIYYLDRGGLR